MCKHLEVFIEVLLIPFYTVLYICFYVSLLYLNQALKPQNRDMFDYKKGCAALQLLLPSVIDFQVFVYIILVMYKIFVSFRKCLGTDYTNLSVYNPYCSRSFKVLI